MATIDQQFVEYIVKTLVSNPDKVTVDRQIDEKGVLLSLTVDPEDVGRVIGRRGATAQSIRALLRALGTKNDARYNLKILNTDEEGGERFHREDTPREEFSAPEPMTVDTAPADAPAEEVAEEEVVDEPASDFSDRTRAELDDLDDLDI